MASIKAIDYTEKAIKQPDGSTKRVRVKLKDKRDWRYEVRYRDPNGKVRRKRFDLKGDAERWIKLNGADILRDEWTDPRARRVLIDEWIDKYVETQLPKVAPTTQRGYETAIRKYIRPHFGGQRIMAIDYQDVEDFIAWMRKQGLGPKRRRDVVSVLNLIFKLAKRSKAVKENPATDHDMSVPKSTRAHVAPLVQLLRLASLMPEAYRLPTLVLIFCGLRPAEMCGLRIEHTNVEKGLLTIAETLQPIQGIEGLVRGPTKNGKTRIVQVPEFLRQELGLYLAARVQSLGRPLTVDDPTFVNTKGGPINRATYQAVLKRRLPAADLPTDFRPYDLRHSHASMLIDAGNHPVKVQQQLGHADVSTTLRHYTHLFAGHQEQLAKELEGMYDTASRAADATRPEVIELADARKEKRRRERAG